MSYMTLTSQEKPLFQKIIPLMTPLFHLFELSHTSDNTTFFKYWGTNAWDVPHLKLWGDRSPSPPRSPPLRTAIKQHRVFSIVGPSDWNSLPSEIRSLPRDLSSSFYKLLKTFIFARAWTGIASE